MNYLTFFAGLFVTLPFVVFVEPIYSGYVSLFLLFLTVDLKKVNSQKLILYFLLVCFVFISLINVDYNFNFSSIIIQLILPLVFLMSDFKFEYKYFFKGAIVGCIIVIISLMYLAYEKNLVSNFVLFFTKNRDWASDNIFYGNGTALLLSLLSSYFLINNKIPSAILINILALLTTSRIPVVMFLFITVYIMLFSSLKVYYKYLLLGFIIVLIVYGFFFIIENEALLNRLSGSEDRKFIFDYSYARFKDNIYLGFGPEDIPLYKHLHNSFFEVLFRYGLFSFVVYVILFVHGNLKNKKSVFILFLSTFFAFTQINLHNINYIILLVMILSYLKNTSFTHEEYY